MEQFFPITRNPWVLFASSSWARRGGEMGGDRKQDFFTLSSYLQPSLTSTLSFAVRLSNMHDMRTIQYLQTVPRRKTKNVITIHKGGSAVSPPTLLALAEQEFSARHSSLLPRKKQIESCLTLLLNTASYSVQEGPRYRSLRETKQTFLREKKSKTCSTRRTTEKKKRQIRESE